MKVASLILYYSVIAFTVLLFIFMLTQDWAGEESQIQNVKYWSPKSDDLARFMTALSGIFVALSYQMNIFAVQSQLRDNSDHNLLKTVKNSLISSTAAYFFVGVFGSLKYGETIQISILKNIG